jgi:hypothetical protein
MVQGPATGLIVSGALSAVTTFAGVLMNLLGITLGSMGAVAGSKDALSSILSGAAGIIGSLFHVGLCAVVIGGAIKMRRLENHALATAAAVLTLVPCTTCCLWGLPLGAWALAVLSKPEVKAAFRA